MPETRTSSPERLTSERPRRRPPLTHVPLSRTPLPELDLTAGPWPGAFERVGELTLHVRRTHGDAPAASATAVYVHGLGGSSTNWTDLGRLLAPHAAGHALDLPGFGASEPMDGFTFSLSAHAEVLGDYLAEHTDAPVHLVGNSMGGAISMLVAAHRPELVRTLTLISPAVPDLRPDPRRLSDPRLALAYLPVIGKRARRELAAMTPRQRAEQVIRLCFADPSSFPAHRFDEVIEEHSARVSYEWAERAMARSTMEIFRTWFTRGAGSLWAVAPRISAPTLVVWGTEDRVISVRKAPRTARLIPRARLLVLPRTGHVAQMERPTTVAKAVLGMWESVEAGHW
ncbi:alpha/beta fold hydrolase [Saccharomonospora glauca]|uniref:Putative hydrolase or acyltransferase of alpha/beta superfamily n=1 Tax=Saccharomonospora glauca K62 TaxID=928724 RepID=I1CYB6_9PSEU|nr:alpha/beta fold hydrolase [Saccharomonospora glauca]EIE97690.1 putative hydrolase or acyltransferase of alpha/beta superfamily [Saccharomonospora glauca K62]